MVVRKTLDAYLSLRSCSCWVTLLPLLPLLLNQIAAVGGAATDRGAAACPAGFSEAREHDCC